jgi:hypothetical protein
VGEGQAAFSHHLDKVAQTELVAQIPTHAKDDDFTVEMTGMRSVNDVLERNS